MQALGDTRFGTEKSGQRERKWGRRSRNRRSDYPKKVEIVSCEYVDDEHFRLVFDDRKGLHLYRMDSTDGISVVKCILSAMRLEDLTTLQIEFATVLREEIEKRLERMAEIEVINKKNVEELVALKKQLANLSG